MRDALARSPFRGGFEILFQGVAAQGTPSPRVQRLQDLPQVQGIARLKVMLLGWQEGWVRQEWKGPAISSQLGHLGSRPPGVKGSAGSQAPLDVAEAASACTEAQVSLWPQLPRPSPGTSCIPNSISALDYGRPKS